MTPRKKLALALITNPLAFAAIAVRLIGALAEDRRFWREESRRIERGHIKD
jgi:hypothetical protein